MIEQNIYIYVNEKNMRSDIKEYLHHLHRELTRRRQKLLGVCFSSNPSESGRGRKGPPRQEKRVQLLCNENERHRRGELST